MLGTSLKIGLLLEGLASGLWTFNQSAEVGWLPAVVGMVAAAPATGAWAEALFRGAGPHEAPDNSPSAVTAD